VGVVQVELELQRVVSDPPAAAQQGENLIEHSVKVSPTFPLSSCQGTALCSGPS
jgi:hypothetical protein